MPFAVPAPGWFDLVVVQQVELTCPRIASYRHKFIQPPSLMVAPLNLLALG